MSQQESEEKLPDLRSMDLPELTKYVRKQGWPSYRAKQIFDWMHRKYVQNPADMNNLPKDIRERLTGTIRQVRKETSQVSTLDGTEKFLYQMDDGQMIETVFMPYQKGNSFCISSQAGCPMGCAFCASTIGGWFRNLTAGEMLGQIYESMRLTGERVSNVVVMGTGEPMLNYDNLIRFLRLLTAQEGVHLSARNITVSTCGIVPGILDLAAEGIPVTLALSLHAATDEKRKSLMPVAKKYSIAETLDACRRYFEKTGRRVTIEYSLMKGVNDSPEDAELLGELLAGRHFHVNLIPVNPVTERHFARSDSRETGAFQKTLEKYHINVTIRKSMGGDIDAACGQLRRKYGEHLERVRENG